jgi:hypothetical protein
MSCNDNTPAHLEEESVNDSLSPEELIREATSSYLEPETTKSDDAPTGTAKTKRESSGSFPQPPTLERLPNLRNVTPGAFHEGGNRRTSSGSNPASTSVGDLEHEWNNYYQEMIERSPSPTVGDETDSHSAEHKPVLEATLVVDDTATISHGTSSDGEERPPIYPAEPIETTIIDGRREDDDNSRSSKYSNYCFHPSKKIIALLIMAVAVTIAAVGVAVSETVKEQNQRVKNNGDSSDDPPQQKIAAENPYEYFAPYDRITQHVALLVYFRPKECQTYSPPKISFTCWHDGNTDEDERMEGILVEESSGLLNCQKVAENSIVCDFDDQQDKRMLLKGELVRSRASALFTCGTYASNHNNSTGKPTAVVEISDLHGYCDYDENDPSTRRKRNLSDYEGSESDRPGTKDMVTLLGLGRLCDPSYIKYLDQVFHAISADDCIDAEVFSSGVILTENHPEYSLSNLTDAVTYCYNSDAHCTSNHVGNNDTHCQDDAVQKVTAIDPLNYENCQATSYAGIESLIDKVSRESDVDRILDYQDELVLRWLVDNDYQHQYPNVTDGGQR